MVVQMVVQMHPDVDIIDHCEMLACCAKGAVVSCCKSFPMHFQLHYGVWLAGPLCVLEKSQHTSHLNCFKQLIHASDIDAISASHYVCVA